MDIYAAVPVLTTAHFTLRLVSPEDAPSLYRVYHDEAAVALMNDDNCDFGFHAATPEQMAETVAYWLRHYGWRSFVRLAILDRTGEAIGTLEGFQGDVGVLRLDIAAEYERADLLAELLDFAHAHFRAWFGNERLVIKAVPEAAERRRALRQCGWADVGEFRGYPDYWGVSLA